MKKFAIALSTMILLAMLSPCFYILAQPTHTPHENPGIAKESPNLISLLLFYSNVFDLAATRAYTDATSMLDKLEDANVPDDLRYLINRYSTLSQQLFTTLDNLETLLSEVETLIARYQVSEARQMLDNAGVALHDAQFLLDDIEMATSTLGDKLGVFAAKAGSQIRLAYDHLDRALRRLRQLTDEFHQLQASLAEIQGTQAVELIPTELSLSITPASVFVGDNITASGRLTADGNPLANRKLTLLLDDESLVTTTDLNGLYTTNMSVLHKYGATMTLKAVYTPADDNIDTYQACTSPPVVINANFYPTFLKVSVPETGYPGQSVTISGQISPTGGAGDRTVRVLLDDTQLTEEMKQSQFNIQITLPPQVSTGEHSLTVVVTPQGRYFGVSKDLTINTSRIPIRVEIQKPLLVLIPKSIEVSGEVRRSLGPLEDARVRLSFEDSSTEVKTSANGSFTTTIDVPSDLFSVGPQEFRITIEPAEPWYAPAQITGQMFIISPANIGLMSAAFVSLGLVVFNRVRPRLPSRREKIVIPEATLQELFIAAQAPRPEHELGGIKDRILSAYLNGLGVVEKVTGTPMAPHTTLREFLNTAAPQLPAAIKPFVELTLIAENTFYSAHKFEESTAARAEQLVVIIKEELYGGAA